MKLDGVQSDAEEYSESGAGVFGGWRELLSEGVEGRLPNWKC